MNVQPQKTFETWRDAREYRTDSDYVTFASDFGPIYEYEAGYVSSMSLL